ncbi:Macrolide-specific efflux protein macA precursor [Serratia entomophila]|uniref:secretion protein HlyD n=1 Tax=Serratia entomophila TaxID=42906 RepID=UPI002177793A|nr:secretion protein HlyD [Serratia entomophila]CAI0971843.1 Macrolide-specific efflux protein macA precursor [Serratia entomophila]CAI0982953.1 Macrolide-specific efflux protein macA precursor [Serratia entomophila]CAI1843236.1 Macrolide-specific efflux protein macA precursor [Serratia entomophila]CAI2109332.1 Macrolide-specific efflux protein macA precursor [Serratia entomophila]CAI2927572.1 Macrolide-specific efflux protein macA precursor [Serratia entomophila]
MNKKRSALIVAAIVLVAAAVYGFWYYQQQQERPLTLYGNVDIRTVNLGFRVDGRLASLTVDEGDAIRPGQLLGKLDDAPYRNALQQAQASVGNARAKLALLQAGYRAEEIAQVRSEMAQRQSAFSYADSFLKRQQGLWAKNATSADALEDARTARNQAQANLQAAKDKLAQYLSGNRPQEIEQAKASLAQSEAALAQAQLNLQDTRLLSPSAGTLLTRAVEPGTMLSAGGTVFTLSLTQPVWVRAYVNEINLGKAAPGTELEIYTDGRPNKPYHGKIGFVSPTAEFTPKSVETPDLRTDLVYRLRVIVTDADDALRQGMPVTIHFAKP